MSRWLTAAVAALALAATAQAQDPAPAPMKIGFVNVTRVLEVAPQAVAAQNRINEEFAPRDEELVEMQRRLRERENALLDATLEMSASERSHRDAEIRSMKRELRRAQEEFREDLGVRRSEELSKLQRQVAQTIREMAEREAYDLVLSNGVVYAGARVDLTDAVIELLDSDAQ